MKEKILVTGGAGAIGSSLCKSLLQKGFDVTILDDLSSGSMKNIPREAHFRHGSVAVDDDLNRVFSIAPKYVIHAAALFANQNSVDHPEKDLSVNGLGTLKILEASRRAAVQKFLYFSSSCIYGNKPVMKETDQDFYPETPYAFTKLLGERYCQFWSHHHGMDTVTLRLFNTYGPGEYPGAYRNVIPNFISLALDRKPLPITGTGEETRSFIFVDDAIRGIESALFAKTKPGDIFNIGASQETRILDLAQSINRLTENPAGIEFRPRRSWDGVTTRRADTSKAQTVLGFSPEVSLDEGLQRTFEWLRHERSENGPVSERHLEPSKEAPRWK